MDPILLFNNSVSVDYDEEQEEYIFSVEVPYGRIKFYINNKPSVEMNAESELLWHIETNFDDHKKNDNQRMCTMRVDGDRFGLFDKYGKMVAKGVLPDGVSFPKK